MQHHAAVAEEGAGAVVAALAPMPLRKHQRLVVLLTEHPQLFVELVRLCSGLDVPGDLELLPGPETVRFPPSERVARWAAKPIDVGRGRMMLAPLVVGPRLIPNDPSLEEARARPDRFALSMIIHGSRPGSLRLARTAMKVARELVAAGDGRSIVLADLIVDSIGRDVRRTVQAEMEAETGWGRTLWFSEIGKAVADGWADGRARGQAEGKIEGIVNALWMVLRARKLEPTKAQRVRIERCRDHRQLEQWLQKALLATRVGEIFGR